MNYLKKLTFNDLDRMFKNYPLYSQDGVDDQLVILEIFINNLNIYWLITEGAREEDDYILFGYCKIHCGEFGYVSFNELKKLNYDIRYNYYLIPVKLNRLKEKYNSIW